MAFHFPRNPRKSIYGGKYPQDCYSSFVFPATCSPSCNSRYNVYISPSSCCSRHPQGTWEHCTYNDDKKNQAYPSNSKPNSHHDWATRSTRGTAISKGGCTNCEGGVCSTSEGGYYIKQYQTTQCHQNHAAHPPAPALGLLANLKKTREV